MSLYIFLKDKIYYPIRLWIYRESIPIKVWKLRRKDKIRVLYVIQSLGAWKSESLYTAMLKHGRFDPLIMVVKANDENDISNIARYLDAKHYKYILNEESLPISSFLKPDIILYQKPYDGALAWEMSFQKNLYSLFCYVNYSFHSIDADWVYDTGLFDNCWQVYFENELCLEGYKRLKGKRARNAVVTGLPVMDELQTPKDVLDSPWKEQSIKKKKIIWAPHHSIGDCWGTHQSTFLEYADYMVEVAKQFSGEVQFAFKPHPILRGKLNVLWGKEKTDMYYAFWETSPNTQLEEGKYIDLFKYSDALIHDCVSFTVEYLYTGNPALFLCRKGDKTENTLNSFAKRAKYCHYLAKDKQDIKSFIEHVIAGDDIMLLERESFYKTNLVPPGEQSSVNNIIDAIIGSRRNAQ